MRLTLALAPRERQQVHTVDDAVRGYRSSGCGRDGREDIDVADRRRDARAGRDSGGPAHEERYADAALEVGRLPAAQRRIEPGQVDVVRRAVVVGEDHQRVLIETLRAQGLHHPADAAVQRADHRRVDAQPVVGDVRERLVILARRLQGRVRCVVGEVEEERAVAVGLDHAHRMIGEVVGEVAVRPEHLAIVEAYAPRLHCPKKLIDRVGVGAGVDHARVVRRQKHGATMLQRQRLVEAVCVGAEARAVAEMPLADLRGMVARALQQPREGDLGLRQPHVLVCGL